jgi:glutathione gamma-glutamylcysteinyltransferase
MLSNNMHSYFALSEQFNTQCEPEYCGPGTLITILNTLKIDPRKQWKGIWRWYSDENLHCTNTELLKKGLSLEEFGILAKCNGAFVQVFRPIETLNEHKLVRDQIAFVASSTIPAIDPLHSKVIIHEDSNPYCTHINDIQVHSSTYNTFRTACIACSRKNSMLLAVNLSRKFLNQTGNGHYSPICGYHNESNSTLLLDIARYKYPPYWINTNTLYDALIPFDLEARNKRGFLVISKGVRKDTQGPICRGIHDPTNMRTMQEYLKSFYKQRHYCRTIGEMMKTILEEKNINEKVLNELKVLLFSYIHDIEKRKEANNALKEITTKLKTLGSLYNQIKEFINTSRNNSIIQLVKEVYLGEVADVLSLFVLALPLGVIDQLLPDTQQWNAYKLEHIHSRILYGEIIILREMLGIMGEHLNEHGFYDSRYVRLHKYNAT